MKRNKENVWRNIKKMTKKQIKKLSKYIKDLYWKGKPRHKGIPGPQRLTVNTFEDRLYDPENNHGFDVCVDNGRFLFTISNYWMMEDRERDLSGGWFKTWDAVQAASLPFYMDQHFFIKTWKPITEEDILRCTRYFLDKQLGLKYKICNIGIKKQYNSEILEEKLKKEKKLNKQDFYLFVFMLLLPGIAIGILVFLQKLFNIF